VLMRMMESTDDPSKLAIAALTFLSKSNSNIFFDKTDTEGFRYFFVVSINREYSFEMHEEILLANNWYFSLRTNLALTEFNSTTLCHLLLLLNKEQNCVVSSQEQIQTLKELNRSILRSLDNELKQAYPESHNFYYLLLDAIEQGRVPDKIRWSQYVTTAKRINLHRTDPGNFSISYFSQVYSVAVTSSLECTDKVTVTNERYYFFMINLIK
jgi:hypothetical protein